MAVKYVNDFAFDSGFGFSGSSGKTPVKSHMRSPMKKGMGGAVKAGPKAPSIAPAMVEKRSQGLGGLAKETKKLAAYNKPHMEGKKGAKVAMYAKGGAVKKAHAKKEMPSFLKAKMMKKADGGDVIAPARPGGPDDGIVYETIQRPDDDREGMGETRGGPRELIPTPVDMGREPPPSQHIDWFNLWTQKDRMNPERYEEYVQRMAPLSGMNTDQYRSYLNDAAARSAAEDAYRQSPAGRAANEAFQRELNRPGRVSLQTTTPGASPLAAVAAARRQAMMPNADLMRRAGEAVRGRMPAPRRAMPVAPKAPMIERGRPMPMEREDIVRSPRQMMQQRGPRGMINRLRVPRGEVMPQPQTIPGRQPALDIGNLPKPPPGYKPKQYIASGDMRLNPETGEYGPSIFQEIIDTAPPAGFVPTLEGRFAKGGRVTKGEKKIGKVMGEFKRGELHSGSKKGPVVKNPKQAVAIALSEARQAGAKIPKKKAMGGRACD